MSSRLLCSIPVRAKDKARQVSHRATRENSSASASGKPQGLNLETRALVKDTLATDRTHDFVSDDSDVLLSIASHAQLTQVCVDGRVASGSR